MNDQQKYLRTELDWIIRQLQVDNCDKKPYIKALDSLDEMVGEEQEKDQIPFDWLFEFRAEMAQVKECLV